MADNFELYRQAVFLVGEGGGSPKPQALKPKGDAGVDWGADFAVITAFNPDGRSPVGDDVARRLGVTGAREEAARLNQAAHLRLKADLLQLTKPRWLPAFLHRFLLKLRSAVQPHSRLAPVGLAEVTGCSPDLVHREPGWAANISLPEALRLGRLCRQDAIFWVSGGALYLVACTPGAIPEALGPWSDRVRRGSTTVLTGHHGSDAPTRGMGSLP